MTLSAISKYFVLTLTEVVAAAEGGEEDLDAEDKVGEADVFMGEGDMELLPRIRSTPVTISLSPIIMRSSTAGSLLQKSRRFVRKMVKSLDLIVIIQVITLQSRN